MSEAASHSLPYRPELDGLRAFAALSVAVFHAKLTLGGVTLLPGGYLAVDIFFVLSGFLIGRQIWNEVSRGEFKLTRFFERRIRRLVPAVILVILTTLVLSALFLSPSQISEFRDDIFPALLFVSNIQYAFEDSYFAAQNLQRPFLHSWSLGVEEQFYLFIPLVFLALAKLKRISIILVLGALSLISLCAAQWASAAQPEWGFYLMPFRFWELGLGVILALFVAEQKDRGAESDLANVMALTSLAILMICLAVFNSQTPHPSLWTLIPVLATAALIYFAPRSVFITQLLSLPPLRLIGRASYSFYLWHFALFALWRITHDGELGVLPFAGITALSLLISIGSYYVLEQPVRRRLLAGKSRQLDIPLMIVAIGGILLTTQLTLLAPAHSKNAEQIIAAAKRNPPKIAGQMCRDREPEDACRYISAPGARELILIGDSHAEALATGLIPEAQKRGYNLTLLLEGGCPLWPGVAQRNYPRHRIASCLNQAEYVADYLSKHPSADVVYFAHLQAYLGHPAITGADGVKHDKAPLLGIETAPPDGERGFDYAAKSFGQSLENGQRRVYLIAPVPWLSQDPVKYLQDNQEDGTLSPTWIHSLLSAQPPGEHLRKSHFARRALRLIAQSERFTTIDPAPLFCVRGYAECRAGDQGGLYYADDNHLSPYGAQRLAIYVMDAVDKDAP